MYYYVYLLISISKKIVTYVGYTNNLSKRINLHNEGKGAKFTKGRKWKLAYYKRYKSKSKALSEEFKLKKDRLFRKKIKNKFLKIK
jgi:putative endonuclease